MPFEAQITQLDSDQLDVFFNENGENQIVSNQPTVKDGEQGSDEPVISPIVADISNIPDFDESEVVEEEGKKKDDEVVEDKDKKPETEEKAVDTEKKEEEKEKVVDTDEIKTVLKNTVEHLINTGQWADWEGREDMEITQEVYAELCQKQDEFRVSKMFNELVDDTGAYGKAIFNHIRNGGNPDEVIDIFKEQQQVNQIDTSTETGKQVLIEKYYKEVVGHKPEKVEKLIKRLISDNEIDSEFNDVKELYDKHYEERLREVEEETKEQQRQQLVEKEAFVSNINKALSEDTSITPKERTLIANSILEFKHNLGGGRKVNDFYLKVAEIQQNPKEYIRLVRFVMDREGYEKSLEVKKETKIAKDTFNFIKGNSAVTKPAGGNVQINPKAGGKQHKGTDFSFALAR